MSDGRTVISDDVLFTGDVSFEGTISSGRSMPAFEDLAAGDYVDTFDDGGTLKARLAIADDKDNPKRAEAYVSVAVTAGNTAEVFTGGTNVNVSGLTPGGGKTIYLSATVPGGVTETAPDGPIEFAQPLGTGITSTSMNVDIDSVPGSGAAEDRLPLPNRSSTPIEANPQLMGYGEQLISTHKKSGFGPPNKPTFIEFIDKATGFLTRQVQTDIALDSPAGNGIAFGPDGTLWYRTGDPVKLYRINSVDGSTTLIGGTTPGTVDDFGTSAMDFHPDGTLYGMMFDLTAFNTIFGHQLVTIDLETGDTTDLGFVIPRGTFCDAFAIKKDPSDPAAFVAINTDQIGQPPIIVPFELHSIDLSTRVLTSIGVITGYEKISGMVFDSDGVLYMTAKLISSGNKELITVNTSTGAPTSIGELKFEGQYPDQSPFSLPDLTIRPRAAAQLEFSPAAHGADQYGHEYGDADAFKVAMHPHPQALKEGMEIAFTPGNSSGAGGSTIQVNELAAVNLVNTDGTPTVQNDIVGGIPVRAIFINGEFRINE